MPPQDDQARRRGVHTPHGLGRQAAEAKHRRTADPKGLAQSCRLVHQPAHGLAPQELAGA